MTMPPLAAAAAADTITAALATGPLPALHQAALRPSGFHVLEPAMFFGFGVYRWMRVFGPLPMRSWFGHLVRLIYIVGVRLAGAVLGNISLGCGNDFYNFSQNG